MEIQKIGEIVYVYHIKELLAQFLTFHYEDGAKRHAHAHIS